MAGAGRRRFRGPLRDWYPDAPFRKACRDTHAFADQYVEAALAHVRRDDERNLVTEKGQQPQSAFIIELAKLSTDRVHLRNQLLGVFVGGHDSTAILVANALFLLSRKPSAWAKLRAEALTLRDQQPLSFHSFKSLTYLRYVLNESKSHVLFLAFLPSPCFTPSSVSKLTAILAP
jgi:cytochrome P450